MIRRAAAQIIKAVMLVYLMPILFLVDLESISPQGGRNEK